MTTSAEVWLLDDDNSILDALAQGLTLEGWHCRTFNQPATLLSNLTANFAGVVLTDLNMPQMDGLQTLAALRQLPGLAEVPVIFMTARLQEAEQQRYLSAGAIAVIEKPFDPLTLGTQLRELCQTKLADSRLSDV